MGLHISPIKAAIVSGSVCVLAAMAACSSGQTPDEAPGTMARVDSEVLTVEEVTAAVPAGLSEADSTAFVRAYVQAWVDEQLLTRVAVEQIHDLDEIDRLTEEYRRQLIMWEYRRLKVSADTALAIGSDDVDAYYAAHADEMKLEEPMVRGIYIKIEDDAPALAQVKKWYKSEKQEDIDRLEKVGLKGAIHYDYFRDTWVPWKQIETKIPTEIAPSQLRKGYVLELSAGGFTYLLSVSDVLPAGSVMPREAADTRIRETLDALRRTEIDARLRDDLRRQAEADGRLYIRARTPILVND